MPPEGGADAGIPGNGNAELAPRGGKDPTLKGAIKPAWEDVEGPAPKLEVEGATSEGTV